MKGKFNQNGKLRTINDLKEELLKSLRGPQLPKPKTNQVNLNNSCVINKSNNPLKTSFQGQEKSNVQPSQKKNSITQNANVNYNSRGTKNPVEIKLEEEANITTSTIDELIQNNDDCNYNLEDSKKKFNDKYMILLENLSNDKSELQSKAKDLIFELFNLQVQFYKSFNQEITTNTKLKELLVLYNQKFRTLSKKSNLIKEGFETNNIKNTLTLTINREESSRINDLVNSNKTELRIFQKILKVNYDETDLNDFKEKNKLNNEIEEKNLLIKNLERIVSDQNIFSKIPQCKRLAIETLCTKYNIKLPDVMDEEIIEGNNNFTCNGPDNEEKKSDEIIIEVKNTEVKKEATDSLDSEVKEFLIQFYLKKPITIIPFKRLGPGFYEYGTQKIMIKKENEVLKVRVGNIFILLERFIELNANSEEFKLMKLTNKGSIIESKKGSIATSQRGSSLKTPTK